MPSYRSSEDSQLLRQAVRGYEGDSCLEIGFGSGSNLWELCERFATVAATEVTRHDRSPEKPDCADLFYCDRASCFRAGSFDFVVFNPPYLPSEGVQDTAVDGGRGGVEVPKRFLDEAVRVLRSSGRILFVLSSEADVEGLLQYCAEKSLALKLVAERGAFFERLYAYEARRLAEGRHSG